MSSQTWAPERYVTNAGFVADLGAPVLDLLAPRPGERILDLGCGDGVLTERLARWGVEVVGVDGSAEMVAAATSRGLDARLMDGQALSFEAEFDAVFSNAALHWMTRPSEVVAGVRRALRPGGRFVGELGGQGNVAAICVALLAVLDHHGVDGRKLFPWYFPSPAAYRSVLETAGFEVDTIELLPRPTPLPTDMAGWLDTFAAWSFAALPEAARVPARREAVALLEPCLCDAEGHWIADYVRLRFSAHRRE